MTTVTVNGIKIYSKGESVTVINGRVTVDGEAIMIGENVPSVTITIEGNVANLEMETVESVVINGSVSSNIETMTGSVTVTGNVNGSVDTMSGHVTVNGAVSGKVSTMSGNISHR